MSINKAACVNVIIDPFVLFLSVAFYDQWFGDCMTISVVVVILYKTSS